MAPNSPIITLTTDFGLADGTVGAMIGVIKSICPTADVITLSADIPAHDIPRGAWALLQSAPFFPDDTIHIGVVDPGVGSNRRRILIITDHGRFIGPDNGLLSWAWRAGGQRQVYEIANPSYRISDIGVTFDGRDVFAPAAAHLALGADPASFGAGIDDPVELSWPEPRKRDQTIEGEIIIVDHFGNLITNVRIGDVADVFGDEPFHVRLSCRAIAPFADSYATIRGDLGAVINGTGLIEIAGCEQSAAVLTGMQRGATIMIEQGDQVR